MIHSVKILTSLIYLSLLLLHLIHSLTITPPRLLTDYGDDQATPNIPLWNSSTSPRKLSRFCSDKHAIALKRGSKSSSIFNYCYLPENFQKPEIYNNLPSQKFPLSLSPDSITRHQNSHSLPCLCTIPGHCFGKKPYFPTFGLIELENYSIHSKIHLKNNSLSLGKVLKSTGLLELSVSLVAPNSTCGDYVIWLAIRNPEFILLQICGIPYMCSENQTPHFRYLLSKGRQKYEPQLTNISSLITTAGQPTDPYKAEISFTFESQ